MDALLKVLLCAAALLSGCASVTTQVVSLNPAQTFPPSQNVEILLEKPHRPYTAIGLLESRGEIGASEADLLKDIRVKAQQLGADAVVRLESERLYEPPMAIYDPWYDPFVYRHYYRPWHAFGPPYGDYRLVGGGYYYVVKALAIKFHAVSKVGAASGRPAPG
ncbi:MAG TPA: hypothetical protein VLN59_10135 [Burkholderiales bacterium]|nr:hypothetical protein [Burkholderiales bacterium]